MIYWNIAKLYCQDVPASLQYDSEKLIGFYLLNEKMNLLLLNAASGSKLEQALEKLVDFGMDAGKDILVAILIYSVGRFIIKQISVLIAKVLEKRKIETSVQTFLKSLVKILLNMVLAFAIISKLGVETTGFAALLASAGVAVGMALSGNLSNFAGGLIILVFKPFKVGDYIDGPGVSGTIKEIQIFHTILSTLDNQMIYVPNGMLSGNAVINYSKQEMRRVEWVFGWNMERMYKGSEPYCNVLFMRTNVFWILLLLSLF